MPRGTASRSLPGAHGRRTSNCPARAASVLVSRHASMSGRPDSPPWSLRCAVPAARPPDSGNRSGVGAGVDPRRSSVRCWWFRSSAGDPGRIYDGVYEDFSPTRPHPAVTLTLPNAPMRLSDDSLAGLPASAGPVSNPSIAICTWHVGLRSRTCGDFEAFSPTSSRPPCTAVTASESMGGIVDTVAMATVLWSGRIDKPAGAGPAQRAIPLRRPHRARWR